MKSYLIPVIITLFVLFGCSGEAYIQVNNNTPATIMVSVNDAPDEVLNAGDTTDVYTVRIIKGVINNIPVDASGEWLGDYSKSVSVSDGENVVHRIHPQLADITIVNTSVDSAVCVIEDSQYLYFAGSDSINNKYVVDGDVSFDYEGRYIFSASDDQVWFPGNSYRFELIPDACEIQLNNIHGNRAIYYVFISPGTATEWGEDRLGDDILNPQEAYVWKVTGDIQWDMRVEAGDTHIDSPLYVYEFYDTEGCESDYTWIYEFPTIFTPVSASSASKISPPLGNMIKSNALNKSTSNVYPDVRIEKIRKTDAGKADMKALRK